jgi:DNA-binding CsgD family transcriptional regulator
MKNIEFYITPKGDVMIHSEKGVRQLKVSDRQFISSMMNIIDEFYPQSLTALSKVYEKLKSVPGFYEFHIARRFIKCNFGKYDSILDIDQFGSLNFEEIECPLRGECPVEGIVCKPKFNSKLTDRELDVMQLYYEGIKPEEIAEQTCLSVSTVKTHKRNAFRRVNVHSIAEFFSYAKQHNLFEH